MNKGVFRLIFNKRLGMLVPTAEKSSAQGKGGGETTAASCLRRRARSASWMPRFTGMATLIFRLKPLALCFAFGLPAAYANPTNPTVVSGSASFNQSGNSLTVTNTPNAIINWGSFSIGQNELTRFVQQSSSSAVLNRVTGQDPSQILGQLQSNGRVFLINPNGVLFGQGARIDVAGLIASSLDISNGDFLAGRLKFAGKGTEAAVKNAGDIRTPSGGQVILIAPDVENNGVITSPNGEIILAAGRTVELANTDNLALRVEITAPEGQALNLGTIIAEGGKVGMYAGLVTQAGGVSATSAVAAGGRIYLKGTRAVTLAGGSVTEASGTKGGGIMVLSTGTTTVEQDARIQADGGQNGQAGDGGFIETSGDVVSIQDGTLISAVSPNGKSGTWLVDPNNITIQFSGPDANITGNPNFTTTADSSILTTTTVQNALNRGTSVTISTGTARSATGAPSTQLGNITVANNITKSSGGDASLTLNAHNDINLNASITSKVGKLNMVFNPDSDSSGSGAVVLGNTTLDANGGTISAASKTVNLPSVTATIVEAPGGVGETEFFKFRCYKNHNFHLEFKRPDLVRKLNEIGGNGLPMPGRDT